MSPSLRKPNAAVGLEIEPDPDPPPPKSVRSPGFLWSTLFSDSVSPIVPSSSPSFLPDGTPVVFAPSSVILKASSSWEGHLLCRFLGEPPSPAKFFSDLNRVWGKFGDITVRRFSSGTFLVHVPSASTRKWILQVGLWSSGTVSFIVSEWSVNPSLASPAKLTSATTILTLRQIPPQLWSQEAVARIAGGVAKLIPGTRASLPLSNLGTATIRAIVPLGSPLPPSVLVKDSHGDSVLIPIDYGRLPHLCTICNTYGHQKHRCPSRPSDAKPNSPKLSSDSEINAAAEPRFNMSPVSELQKDSMVMVSESSDQNSIQVNLPPQAPEVTDPLMDIDIKASEELVPKNGIQADIDPIPQITETNAELHKESMIMAKDSSTQKLLQAKSFTQIPEVTDQNMDLDIIAGEKLVPKCVMNSDIDSTNPISEELRKELDYNKSIVIEPNHSLDPTDEAMKDDCLPLMLTELPKSYSPPQVQPSTPTHVDHLMSAPLVPLGTPKPLASSALVPEDQIQIPSQSCIVPRSDQISSFSYPPPDTQALKLELEQPIPSSLLELTPQTQPSRKSSRAKGQRESSSGQRQAQQVINSTLKCKASNYNFKSKGVVEKRKKLAQKELWSEYEDLQPSILELEDDKKNSTYYETLRAFKLLQNSEQDNPDSLDT